MSGLQHSALYRVFRGDSCGFCLYICFVLFLNHAWWCLELTTGSALREHSWKIQGSMWGAEDRTCVSNSYKNHLLTALVLHSFWGVVVQIFKSW